MKKRTITIKTKRPNGFTITGEVIEEKRGFSGDKKSFIKLKATSVSGEGWVQEK